MIGDVRDLAQLRKVFEETEPEIVLHLAAQPIVRDSYREPVYTYETNVMGTVNLLECVRLTPSVKSVLNVTTDKVYENREWEYGYRECDPLDLSLIHISWRLSVWNRGERLSEVRLISTPTVQLFPGRMIRLLFILWILI